MQQVSLFETKVQVERNQIVAVHKFNEFKTNILKQLKVIEDTVVGPFERLKEIIKSEISNNKEVNEMG